MKYRVEWGPIVEDQLAALWLASGDRSGVSAVADWFDQELARGPLTLGESRASSLEFIAFHPPLGIEYEVVPDDNLVIVLSVFVSGPRGG